MGDVINLNKVRKAREKRFAKAAAAENRIRFGQSKANRETMQKEAERADKELDGKQIDDN